MNDKEVIKKIAERLRQLGKDTNVKLSWDYNGWRELTDSDAPFTQKDWNATIVTMFNMAKKQLDNNANCLVVSLEAAAILDDNPLFNVSIYTTQDPFTIWGMLGNYKIYRDDYLPAGHIVIGNEVGLLDLTNETKVALVSIKGLQILNGKLYGTSL